MNLSQSSAVGLPGLAAMAAGFVPFVLSLFVARTRSVGDTGKQQKSTRSVIGIIVQGAGIAYAGFGPIDVSLDPLSPLALGEAVLIAVLMGIVIWLFAASARALGQNWSLVARTRSDHSLVRTGPFAHLRHPIYTALFLFMLALTVAYGHPWHLLIAVPLFAIGTWMRIREEEELLRAMFGRDYDDYASRVRRFVPGVF